MALRNRCEKIQNFWMLFYTSNNLERKKEEDDDTRRYTRR
jgi:hypothetical protein